jgi:hypothetical protein
MQLSKFINARIAASNLPTFVGKPVSRTKIRKELNDIFRPFKVRFRLRMDETVYSHDEVFPTSGYFDEKNPRFPITCFLHFYPDRTKMKLSKRKMDIFIFRVVQVVYHEMAHWEQHKQRKKKNYIGGVPFSTEGLGKKKRENMLYYAEYGELESYAHDIAMEIRFFYPNVSYQQIFNNIGRRKKLDTYQRYVKVYRGENWTNVRKHLLKKIWKWLPTIELPAPVEA